MKDELTSLVPSSSPVPIAPTNRLLSTKLSTAPISKTTSPNPPPPPAPSASPWAKPAEERLHQPAPKKLTPVLRVPQKSAWRSVGTVEGKGRLSRDFPTANEIAEGEQAWTKI